MNLLDARLRLAECALRYCVEGISLKSKENKPLGVPNGWVSLVDKMLDQLLALPTEDHPQFATIGRSEGQLDFRWSEGSGAADRILSAARARAAHTCELCGEMARRIFTPVGTMTLCRGHADMDLVGQDKITIEEALSTGAPFLRPKILIMLRKLSVREVWILSEGDEEQEFHIDDASWLLGWLEGTNERADLYAIDSLQDVTALYQLQNRAGMTGSLTLRDARSAILAGASRRGLCGRDLDRLIREREHGNREIRMAAHLKLTTLFDDET